MAYKVLLINPVKHIYCSGTRMNIHVSFFYSNPLVVVSSLSKVQCLLFKRGTKTLLRWNFRIKGNEANTAIFTWITFRFSKHIGGATADTSNLELMPPK